MPDSKPVPDDKPLPDAHDLIGNLGVPTADPPPPEPTPTADPPKPPDPPTPPVEPTPEPAPTPAVTDIQAARDLLVEDGVLPKSVAAGIPDDQITALAIEHMGAEDATPAPAAAPADDLTQRIVDRIDLLGPGATQPPMPAAPVATGPISNEALKRALEDGDHDTVVRAFTAQSEQAEQGQQTFQAFGRMFGDLVAATATDRLAPQYPGITTKAGQKAVREIAGKLVQAGYENPVEAFEHAAHLHFKGQGATPPAAPAAPPKRGGGETQQNPEQMSRQDLLKRLQSVGLATPPTGNNEAPRGKLSPDDAFAEFSRQMAAGNREGAIAFGEAYR